jgi:hypothetical protein
LLSSLAISFATTATLQWSNLVNAYDYGACSGNFISLVVGFCIATSVTTSAALEGISTSYMDIFPEVDSVLQIQALLVLDLELGLSRFLVG